jgi:hypothetical protein
MDEAKLQEIEARANAATPGPWQMEHRGVVAGSCRDVIDIVDDCAVSGWRDYPANQAFIAAARTDVPELVAEVRRLTAALDAVTAEHAAALDAARREGAEDMRAHAAEACDAFAEDSQRELEEHGDGDYGTAQWIQGRESGANVCADLIRTLPLDAPGGGS